MIKETTYNSATKLPEYPCIKPWYRTTLLDGSIVIEFGDHAVQFDGRGVSVLLPALLPMLDGSHTIDGLIELLGAEVKDALLHALGVLNENDLLRDGKIQRNGKRAFYEDYSSFMEAVHSIRTKEEIESALLNSSVVVIGNGLCSTEIANQLVSARCGKVSLFSTKVEEIADSHADLIIAVPRSDELIALEKLNEFVVSTRRALLPVTPYNGQYIGIGPLIIPPDTCCYKCFQTRRASHIRYAKFFPSLEHAQFEMPIPRPVAMMCASLAVVVACDWLVLGSGSFYPSALVALEIEREVSIGTHKVYKVPRCSCCSLVSSLSMTSPWCEKQ